MKSWHSTRENSCKLTVSDLKAYKIGCSESVWKRNLYESQKGMDDLEVAVFQRVVGAAANNSLEALCKTSIGVVINNLKLALHHK